MRLTTRQLKFFEIIKILNVRKQQGIDGLYDCGDLGIAFIWWGRRGWEVTWYELSTEFKNAEGGS